MGLIELKKSACLIAVLVASSTAAPAVEGSVGSNTSTVYSWHGLAAVIGSCTSCGLSIALGADLSDYDAQITIPQNTTVAIEGNGYSADALGQGRFFLVEGTLVLNSLTLKNGFAGTIPPLTNHNGGAIYNNNGTCAVTNSMFLSNTAGWGGAIYNTHWCGDCEWFIL
jgi:hypothetical protein